MQHCLSTVLTVLLLAACSQGPPPMPGETTDVNPTVRLDLPRSEFPGPGMCRIMSRPDGRGENSLARSCEGIEHVVPEGAVIVYRPANAREIHIRYMDSSTRGVVYRTDIFDMDTLRLIREIN